MELAIAIWAIGALFTAGYLSGAVNTSIFPKWKMAILATLCVVIWPAFLGITVGMAG